MSTSMATSVAAYPWSDSWLLYSILYASRAEPAELAKIISEGDHYNHAVFTHEELYGGLDRLVSGGWVISHKHQFSASVTAVEKYSAIQKQGLSCYDEMKSLEEALNSPNP